MRERPILFSAPMVRAILDGSKTQTRRVVKVPEGFDFTAGRGESRDDPANWGGEDADGMWWALAPGEGVARVLPCPYGQPSDRLWVKETIRKVADHGDGYASSEYAADGAPTVADAWPWQRPTLVSIHCPRGLSRIDLEVTAVRVERLQACSANDAWAEGIPYSPVVSPVHEYEHLWESINGPGSWAANPFVWVVEFRRDVGHKRDR